MSKIFKDKENKDKKVLMLIDSHALLHRGYHAMPDFYTRDGRPTGALFGFLKMIKSAYELVSPDYVIACYDLPKPTFRHIAYDAYKGTRQKTDDDLKVQINQSKVFCEKLSIPVCELEGYEADDLLGTISKNYSDKYNIVIVSGDMDTLQLVNQNVKVCTLKKAAEVSVYGEKEVFEKYELTPKQVPDYKGLAGDAGDNIPGVSGVGAKTAIKILKEFNTVEELYEKIKADEKNEYVNINKIIKGKVFESLKNSEEEAMFSKTLGTIILDAPIDEKLFKSIFGNTEYQFGVDYKKEEYEKLCESYDLRTLKNIFSKDGGGEAAAKKENTNTEIKVGGLTIDQVNGVEILEKKAEVSKAEVAKIEISKKELNELQVMSVLIDSEKLNQEFDDIKNIHEIQESKNFEEVKNILIENLKKEIIVSTKESNTEDKTFQDKELDIVSSQKNMYDYFKMIEQPLFEILENMSSAGVLIDTEQLEKQKIYIKDKIQIAEKEIHDMAGCEFLISSPKQLGETLYDKMGLGSKIKKTATGKRSTGIEMLESIKDEHPIIEKIINWREIVKVYNTYLEPLNNYIKEDGKVHPRFLQAGAATGRFSCEEPNMQNLPRNSELGLAVRKCFISGTDNIFISADYSQIDLRSAAILSHDEKLLEIFKNGTDIHRGVAAQVLNKNIDGVTDDERRKAKAINFGILYGMGVNALKDSMGTDRKTAQDFYDNFKNTFSTLMTYLEKVKYNTYKNGYTETLFGRRRSVPMIQSKLPFLRAQGERIAINAPIQGTSADIIKLGMIQANIALQDEIKSGNINMLLQIHDELVFECREKDKEKYAKIITESMQNVLQNKENQKLIKADLLENIDTPIIVNIAFGKSLFEL